MSKKWFDKKFDCNKFYRCGFESFFIEKEQADMLLSIIKQEQMVPIARETLDNGEMSRYYRNRLISKKSLYTPTVMCSEHKELLQQFHDFMTPLFEICGVNPSIEDHGLTSYLGMPGYCMEDHTDVGDRALAIAMLYLSDDIFDKSTGGELTISAVTYNPDGTVKSRDETDKIYPNHGQVVIINARDPLFQHGVLPLVKEGMYRYSLFIPIYSLNIGKWHIEFEQDVIGIDNRKVYKMDDLFSD